MPSPAILSGGLTTAQVAQRRRRDGANTLPTPPRPSAWRMFGRQLVHLLALLLWAGAALALVAGIPQVAVAILVILLLNAGFAFWQEYRADRAAEHLRTLLPSAARVLRNGRVQQVGVQDLVVDDLVLLSAGDRVGADMVLTDARSLRLDESLVTGESGGVSRHEGDRLMAGTFVVVGEGRAVVVAVGARTGLADIASLTAGAQRPASPLTVQLDRVVRIVALIAAATGATLGTVSLLLGLHGIEAFIFGVGVTVALVPEGLLPTVTLSLAHGARLMARQQALVRRLDAVETLGATTFICTDKTGTLTQNRMSVVEVLTSGGPVAVHGHGYHPVATISGDDAARARAVEAAAAALACVTGRAVHHDDSWAAEGDPMEAAIHCLALRLAVRPPVHEPERLPYSAERLLSSALCGGTACVLGAPESVLARCAPVPPEVHEQLVRLTSRGRRVLAVAHRSWDEPAGPAMEEGLQFLALLALQDPPRPDVSDSLATCQRAGIRVAMLTGDHPETARAVALEVGLLGPEGVVLEGRALPADDAELAATLDTIHGAVVARVSPADKLRIARVLRDRGHVVAMTGDGVNDAPALREADVGVAMGASGSDVAREAADLVLLDDHFATIVRAVELGRATFQNIRRFLTYHLTDNVAELAPFAVWAVSGGSFPLAIAVLQVLALDIGTDLLPALALGGEPPREGIMDGRRRRTVIDRALLLRAFLVLGPTEAVVSLTAFTVVLVDGGWRWGETPSDQLMMIASGTAFTAIAAGQMANAFACRSTRLPVWRLSPLENPWVVAAVIAEAVLVAAFVGLPPLVEVLGGSWPSPLGWAGVGMTAAAVALVDGVSKSARRRPRPAARGSTRPATTTPQPWRRSARSSTTSSTGDAGAR